jgi:polysaccharide deacetylase 2 family uncharacterized protein YibQ
MVFWSIVAALVLLGAVTLQVLGPPPGNVSSGAPAASAKIISNAPAGPKPPPSIPAPLAELQEPAPDFQGRTLPVKAPDGRAPAVAYAAPFNAADKHPRVALVISGAGQDQDQTLHLLRDLPGAIDVAFSAYMDEDRASRLAAVARDTGHECVASIPMEPNNFPLADEGARQLMEGHDTEANRVDLEWALSRQPGCVGATGASDGMMGERFAQNGLGFSQVLEELGKRGLLYLDPRTGAPALASATETSILVADTVIDQATAPDQPVSVDIIDQRLAELEKKARERGTAIGLAGPPQPAMLERIAVWAHGLAARGVTLAPLTAVQQPPKAADGDTP